MATTSIHAAKSFQTFPRPLALPPPPPGDRGTKQQAGRAAAQAALAALDLSKVQIEEGVPLPPPTGQRRDFTPLLRRLKPQQSAVLPLPLRSTLTKAITDEKKLGKARYSVRVISANELRVWRTE